MARPIDNSFRMVGMEQESEALEHIAGLYAVVYVVLAAPQVAFLSRAIPSRLERSVRRTLNWHAWGL